MGWQGVGGVYCNEGLGGTRSLLPRGGDRNVTESLERARQVGQISVLVEAFVRKTREDCGPGFVNQSEVVEGQPGEFLEVIQAD